MPEESTVLIPVSVVFPIPEDLTLSYLAPDGTSTGCRVMATLKRRKTEGVVVETGSAAPEGIKLKAVERVLDETSLFGRWTMDLAKWLADFGLCSLGEALGAMLPGGRREKSAPLWDDPVEGLHKEKLELSGEQLKAVQGVRSGTGSFYYLRGMTGSGKTEVYLRLAASYIADGLSVIFLVPEISLTHQLIEEIQRRFGTPAVLHSGLTPSQRLSEWRRIQKGEALFILGARSAIFAPVISLGLIILDEEPESSYKSGAVPRFHARSAAMALAKITGAKVVLGSATPSLEALEEIRKGTLVELILSRRLAGGAPPKVQLVDTRGESGLISSILAESIIKSASEGRQSVLLLNRRGFTFLFHCLSCHYEMHCPSCSAPMTFHKSRNLMICHHCGLTTRPPSHCPNCGSHDVGWGGVGTEMVEEEIQRVFPGLTWARLDADTAAERGKMKKIIRDFSSGKITLLLGTQMVAKGLNFPGLKTVGLLNADIGLSMPDFRAAERVYSLIRQTTGRTGRYHPDGEVFIQTWRPDFWVMKAAEAGDDALFVTKELEIRKQLQLPPYSRLLRVVIRNIDLARAQSDARETAKVLAEWNVWGGTVSFLGPAECAMELLNGWHRRHILVRAAQTTPLRNLGQKLRHWTPPYRSRLELDLDPVSLR